MRWAISLAKSRPRMENLRVPDEQYTENLFANGNWTVVEINDTALNEQQVNIVKSIHGPILVVAPVGTGKTRVLAERVVNAVEHGTPADNVLCLTFTNRAAQEMRSRLKGYSADSARQATIKTFHALCALMLKREARDIGLAADFIIYDEMDALEIVKDAGNIPEDKIAKRILTAILDCKVNASKKGLSLSGPWDVFSGGLESREAEIARRYQKILQHRHGLDFADLIYFTRAMLQERKDIRERWEQRFSFIQVDEVQDTQITEYEIVQILARRSRNIAMIGDIDQTIYGWRGSAPEVVLGQYHTDFHPVEFPLVYNYRATKTLLGAADSFADSFIKRYTRIEPAAVCEKGEPVRVHQAADEKAEGRWIGEQIQKLAGGNPNFAFNRVAVLARTNQRNMVVSGVLREMGIPHLTVEQFEFFRRQEVKDALAYLRLLLNPYDANAIQRVLQRPGRGIGETTIAAIISAGESCGLQLTDMIDESIFTSGDPFGNLLNCHQNGRLVVFDLETTGLSAEKDEVIEIAAEFLVDGKPSGQYHRYLRNSVPVGESQGIHGYSDEFLRLNGGDPQQVFAEFLALIDGALLVGHNVGYDVKMLSSHARRLGLPVQPLPWADTLNIAFRMIPAKSYRLEALVEQLGLPNRPTHKAMDDVQATIDLLSVLIPLVQSNTNHRRSLVNKFGRNFQKLAQQYTQWKQAIGNSRPPALLAKILNESGLQAYYADDGKRRSHLDRLLKIFSDLDKVEQHPETSLRSLVEFTALASNVDYLATSDNQVPVITIHQAKGLEFDTVFIAGAVEGVMPDFRSDSGEELLEEQHVFYVALTRAKKRLFISSFCSTQYGRSRPQSRFVKEIDTEYLRNV